MNYYNNTYIRLPRKRVIIFASLVFTVIFSLAAYSVYVQQTDLAHSVHLSPTSANYGTLSTARPQALAVPMQSTAPFLSGGEIRSYAYNGHATMPKATSAGSGFKIHITSSASVHSIGGGGAGGGGAFARGTSSSSRGMTQQATATSVSFPSLTMVTPVMTPTATTTTTTTETTPSKYGIAPRRAPGYSGSYEGEQGEDGGKYWIWDGESWIEAGAIPVGTTKIKDGITYRWNGSEWEVIGNQQDPGVPVGNAPWLLLLFLAGIYARHKKAIRIQPK